MRTPDSIRRATFQGFGAVAVWSTTVALARSLSEGLGPLAAGAAVYSIGGFISLVPLVLSSDRRRQAFRLPTAYALVCGGLFVLYTVALFAGVGLARTRLQAVEVGLLNYLWPSCTLLLSVPILGHRARLLLLFPGTLLALWGIFLVLVQDAAVSPESLVDNLARNPAAYICGIVAAVSWGLYSTLARRLGGSGQGGVHLFIPAAGLVLLLAAIVAGRPLPDPLPRSILIEAAFLGILTSVSYRLWDSAMRGGSVVAVAAASYTTPLLSTLVVLFYLSVQPGIRLWIGCFLLVTGSLISWRSIRPPEAEELIQIVSG